MCHSGVHANIFHEVVDMEIINKTRTINVQCTNQKKEEKGQRTNACLGKREAVKKILLLMAGPLRPTPLELNGRWNVGTLEKKVKKSYFFPNGPPSPSVTPPSLNGPSIKRRTFFCSFLL